MQSTRQRILDTLEQRGSASARQLSQAFGMTSANLRRHLSILEGRGLIAPVGQRHIQGRGRPEAAYALTERARSDNLVLLSDNLLYAAEDAGLMKRVAKRILGNGVRPSGHISQRLVAAVQRLNPMGYRANWEARPQGPQMVLGHCPYAAIISDHPELCQMDAHMLAELLGTPVEQTAKLQPGPQGVPQCLFVLQTKPTA